MSVLQVTNIRSNSTSFNTPVVFQTSGGTENGQLARAWVNFNGQGTVAIRADFNVNTVGDNGTGDYTVNLSSALADTNYATVAGTSFDNNVTTVNPRTTELTSTSSSAMRMRTIISDQAIVQDLGFIYAAIFR